MSNELKNPYAKQANGTIISILSASRDGEYFCIGCGEQLIFKEGAVISRHFAHKAKSDCLGGIESTIHIKAKEAFVKRNEAVFRLPNSSKSRTLNIISAREEVAYQIAGQRIVVDVVIETREMGEVFVEIYNTHKTEKEKASVIRALGRPCIEIDVSPINHIATPETEYLDDEEFIDLVTRPSYLGNWLAFPSDDEYVVELKESLEKEISEKYKAKYESEIRDLTSKLDDLQKKERDLDKKTKEATTLHRQLKRLLDKEQGGIEHKFIGDRVGYAFIGDNKRAYIYLVKEDIDSVFLKTDKKGNLVVPIVMYKKNGKLVVECANGRRRSSYFHTF